MNLGMLKTRIAQFLRWMGPIPLMLAVYGAASAQGFPLSRFTERVSATGITVFGVDDNLAENIVVNQPGIFGKAETSGSGGAVIPGGSGPSAEAILNAVDGGVVSASVTYHFGVSGPVHPSPIPLLIDARLLVEVEPSTIVRTQLAQINVFSPGIINDTESLNACTVGSMPVCADRRRDLVFDLGMPIGAEGTINLRALLQGAGGRMRAVADPFIRVDPAFPLASQYSIVVSSNVINAAPIPEASTASLLLAGLAVVAFRALRKERSNLVQ